MWSTADLVNGRVFMEMGKSEAYWGEFPCLKVRKIELAQVPKKRKRKKKRRNMGEPSRTHYVLDGKSLLKFFHLRK